MGHGENYSSESDDDSNARHDRFRSERFKDSSLNKHLSGSSKSWEYSHNKSCSKKYRERSPPRSRYDKNESSQRKESRKKHGDISQESNSNKHDKFDLRNSLSSYSEKKHSDQRSKPRKRDDFDSSKTGSKKLSSILLNFDKKVESKRLNSQSLPQIGPTLPPHLAQKLEEDKELNLKQSIVGSSIAPAPLPDLEKRNTDNDMETENFDVTTELIEVVENNIGKTSSCEGANQSDDEPLSSMGPSLPPHLQDKHPGSVETEENEQKGLNQKVKPSSPLNESDTRKEIYGPALPPKLEEDSYGPALPPNFKKQAVQGPKLPEGMTCNDLERLEEEDSEDEDTFGPLPAGKMNMTQYQLELRAMDIKRKLEEEKSGSSKDIKKREEWMLELPPEKASNLGLGPRSFRMKERPDMSNRSAWTDTPSEKKRKEEMALRGESEPVSSEEAMRTAFVKERNETMEKISKLSQDEDRQKSLLEIHQKKIKKKKKKEDKEGKKKERRPFDRNIDLQVHRFDEAQKKAIFKKAQLLDTRFSSGESKFL